MGNIIGIDLGTSNCCAAVVIDDKPVVIPNGQGALITPSVVSFEDDGTCLVGEPARRRAILHPQRTIYSVKRFMGESYDATKELAESMPYRVGCGQYHYPQFDGGTRWLTSQEVSAEILRTIKHNAEDFLGAPVDEAVITVPAYFNELQRQATKVAGELAGFKVRRIISEPTAAALAYGLGKSIKNEDVAVFHLGGGTFDTSILSIGDGVYDVRSTCGNTHLGGDDFDKAIVDWLAEEFKCNHNVDLRQDPTALQRLREAAEKAKIELSSSMEAEINLPFIATVDGVPQSLAKTLTRAHFESLCDKLLAALEQPCRTALRYRDYNIKKVLLVGGGTRIPAVQKKIGEIFGMEPSMNVNPDEAVAIGAAIQGAVMTGQVKDTLLLDVIPLSLGIETQGGIMTILIYANSTIPAKHTQTFTTTVDNQTEVHLRVLQGERAMANDNKTIARITLNNIPPAPRGVPQIEVTFDIDASSILGVSATEKSTGKSINARVESAENITEEDFRRCSDYYSQPLSISSTTSSASTNSTDNSSSANSHDTSSSDSYTHTGTSSQTHQRPAQPSYTPTYGYTPTSSWWSEVGQTVGGLLLFILLVGVILYLVHSCTGQDDAQKQPYKNYSYPSYRNYYHTPNIPSTTPAVPKHTSAIHTLPELPKATPIIPEISNLIELSNRKPHLPYYPNLKPDLLEVPRANRTLFETLPDTPPTQFDPRSGAVIKPRSRSGSIPKDSFSFKPMIRPEIREPQQHYLLKKPQLQFVPLQLIYHDNPINSVNLDNQTPAADEEQPAVEIQEPTDATTAAPSAL